MFLEISLLNKFGVGIILLQSFFEKNNQLILKKNGYEEKHIVLDDTNSLDFVRVNLESFEDLCFLCHEYLIKGDFDNAAEILSRIEKINIESYEYALLMSVYEFYVNN